MPKTLAQYRQSLLVEAVGVFAILSFLGCANHETAIIETPQAILETASPISSETPQPSLSDEGSMSENSPHVSPYVRVTVVDVEVHYLPTNPGQIELLIRGTLPDQCKYDFYSVENRVDQTVRVSLDGIHPADMSCSQIDQTIEYELPLGRDMPEAERGFSPGDYQLKVNNYQTSFSIK
jgi:hypothetical protein